MGSAAFSKAVQCLDLHTGESVCIKIIKNNKDFFDQSLDEIKLLRCAAPPHHPQPPAPIVVRRAASPLVGRRAASPLVTASRRRARA